MLTNQNKPRSTHIRLHADTKNKLDKIKKKNKMKSVDSVIDKMVEDLNKAFEMDIEKENKKRCEGK